MIYMRYITLTFDDGRKDNYCYANPILNKYDMDATLFCTTGFIDGSFQKPQDWNSAGDPLSINQVLEMERDGWEIALHGDQHITETQDCINSIRKIHMMGVNKEYFGFSLPNSEIPQSTFMAFKDELYPRKLKYIRGGRAIDTSKISSKLLFAAYTYGNLQKAYNVFNQKSVIDIKRINLKELPSVVIRYKDKPEMILEFLSDLPDDTWTIFMLHSILPDNDQLYGTDPWNWSVDNFEQLLIGLKQMKNVTVDTLSGVIDTVTKRCGGI